MVGVVLRPFEGRDWPDMVRFYEEFYRPGYIFIERRFFDWNFFSPLRPDDRSGQYLALVGDRIIGIMGALAWPLQIAGETVLGEYNVNLYVDSAYRGHRLSQRLLEAVSSGYAHSLTNGYNARTLSLYERLGAVYHWRMRRFVKVLEAEAADQLLEASPRFGALEADTRSALRALARESASTPVPAPAHAIHRCDRFDASWDRAWERIRRSYGFTTWRSSEFLNWRYIDYPFPLYRCLVTHQGAEPTGLIVLRRDDSPLGPVVRIVDLAALPERRLDLLGAAEAFARDSGAILVDRVAAGECDAALLEQAGYREFEDADDAMLLPLDFAPVRYRDAVLSLATFLDREDPGRAEFEAGRYTIVKGDGDLDRAN